VNYKKGEGRQNDEAIRKAIREMQAEKVEPDAWTFKEIARRAGVSGQTASRRPIVRAAVMRRNPKAVRKQNVIPTEYRLMEHRCKVAEERVKQLEDELLLRAANLETLIQQNQVLRQENERLRQKRHGGEGTGPARVTTLY
jgi:hypothetical protein